MKKENIVTYAYYAVLAALSLGMLYRFNGPGVDRTGALLDFYKNVVEVFFSNYHYYNEEMGHYVGTNYVIGKGCLGLNIIALIFGVCGFVNVGRLTGLKRVLWLLLSGLAAVVIGIFANILRLLSSIYFTSFVSFGLIHALLGIVIYLSAVIFCYMFSMRITRNAKGGADVEEHI